jgi:hypothetical protein
MGSRQDCGITSRSFGSREREWERLSGRSRGNVSEELAT